MISSNNDDLVYICYDCFMILYLLFKLKTSHTFLERIIAAHHYEIKVACDSTAYYNTKSLLLYHDILDSDDMFIKKDHVYKFVILREYMPIYDVCQCITLLYIGYFC